MGMKSPMYHRAGISSTTGYQLACLKQHAIRLPVHIQICCVANLHNVRRESLSKSLQDIGLRVLRRLSSANSKLRIIKRVSKGLGKSLQGIPIVNPSIVNHIGNPYRESLSKSLQGIPIGNPLVNPYREYLQGIPIGNPLVNPYREPLSKSLQGIPQ